METVAVEINFILQLVMAICATLYGLNSFGIDIKYLLIQSNNGLKLILLVQLLAN